MTTGKQTGRHGTPLARGILATALLLVAFLYGCNRLIPQADIDPRLLPPEQTMEIYLTGYSYWDNSPPKSRIIARPAVHRFAGGVGTFRDPVTIAVGHRIEDGVQTPDFPLGVRFYLPALKKYAIIEDLCGDGPTPQDGPCHIGHEGRPWLDVFVDGRRIGAGATEVCMRHITGLQEAILFPQKGYEVDPGPIDRTTCAEVVRDYKASNTRSATASTASPDP